MEKKQNSAEITTERQNVASMKTSKKEKLFYGLGDMGNNLILMFVGSFLTLYYTDSAGMAAAFIGTMMLVSRVLDGVSDIVMGIIIDKTRTRWGKARPWILFMAIPFAVSVLLVFNVPAALGVSSKNIYVFLTYIFLTVVCNTAVNLSYLALLPLFSLTSQDRSVATVVRSIFATIASLAVAMMTPSFLMRLGGIHNQAAWSTLAAIYAALSVILLFITFLGVREKVQQIPSGEQKADKKEGKPSLSASLKILLSTRYFYITVLLFITFYVTNGNSGIGIYYARDVLGNAQIFSFQALLSVIPMLIAMPFMPLLFRKFGKRNTMMGGLAISALACSIGLLNPRSIPLYLSIIALRGFGTAALSTAIFTLAGDIVDFNEWKTGIRTEGLATSANSFGIKLGTGLGSAMVGWGLALGQYNPELAVQMPGTINAMIMVALGIPLIVYILCIVMLIFWNLEKYQPQVVQFIADKYHNKDNKVG
ncbi:MAG: MFS transporter [Treponema sp.]|nr:MFS transporter [Treponema sp.]